MFKGLHFRVCDDQQCCKKWTAEVDDAITRMIADSHSYSNIASELGNGLNRSDIKNRWNRNLKKSTGTIKPSVQWSKCLKKSTSIIKPSMQGVKTWTAEVDDAITHMKVDGYSYTKVASEFSNGLKMSDILNRWTCHLKS